MKYKYSIYSSGKVIASSNVISVNNWTWVPKSAGKYTLAVETVDDNKVIVKKSITFSVSASSIKFTSLSIDKASPQKVNTTVNISANAIGQGTVKYKFSVYLDGKLLGSSDASTINKWKWTPKKVGSYKLVVYAMDNTKGLISKSTNFIIK